MDAFRGMYGTTSGGDQMGAPKDLPEYAYGSAASYGPYGKVLAFPSRKRLNIVAVGLSLFVPWLIFVLIYAVASFSVHYTAPAVCNIVIGLTGIILVLLCLLSGANLYRARMNDAPEREEPSWSFFLYMTALLAFVMAVGVGNRNFTGNMQPYYDLTSLNTYAGVDPARMRGQELMDAGQLTFVEGTRLDLVRSMAFKNQETYCVVPITGGSVEGNPPLTSYDFFAVGKNCCEGSKNEFQCDGYNSPEARAGVRLVRDEERAFYRLAVQQAQSAFGIRATHPLFFHWVVDPMTSISEYRRDGFKWYMTGMIGHFVFQLLLVWAATYFFSKIG